MINTAFFSPRNLLIILLVGSIAVMVSNRLYAKFCPPETAAE